MTIRCAACTRRIRSRHPYIGIKDLATGKEIAYHGRPACQKRASEEISRIVERGRTYILNHYHTCGDEASGFGCRGGCFTSEATERLCTN